MAGKLSMTRFVLVNKDEGSTEETEGFQLSFTVGGVVLWYGLKVMICVFFFNTLYVITNKVEGQELG